jgi:hypothetical protein
MRRVIISISFEPRSAADFCSLTNSETMKVTIDAAFKQAEECEAKLEISILAY